LDDYVGATAPLERSVVLRTNASLDPASFAAAMGETALGWSEEEMRTLAPALGRLARFIAPMKWRTPPEIVMVKATDELMNGFPHTRANAIVLQEGMLAEVMKRDGLREYLLAHEAFHVFSRADSDLREALYGAIGFRACAAVDIPPALAGLRLTNPDAPQSRHAITLRRGGQPLEVLPFVHFTSHEADPRAGFAAHVRTSWLPIERAQGRCKARDERLALGALDGLAEQAGGNTGYVIHPEEILADNFALLFRKPAKVASPQVLERMRRMLLP
jgi:hypothetical protein